MSCVISILLLTLSGCSYLCARRVNIAQVNCTMWAILSFFVVLLGLPQNESGFVFILANTVIFSIFHALPNLNQGDILEPLCIKEHETEEQLRFEKVNKCIGVISLLSLMYISFNLGFGPSSFSGVSALMAKMNSISHMRYSGEGVALPVISRIINTLSYAVCGFAGFFSAKRFKKEYMLNMIIFVGQTIVLNTKATLVFAVAFFAGGFLTGLSYYGRRIRIKSVFAVVVVAAFIIILVSCVDYFRHVGRMSFTEEIEVIMEAYLVGPLSAFSIWFTSQNESPLELGANTFSCIFRIMGVYQHSHGEHVNLSVNTGTNVYTIYKHLINDYSIVGTLFLSAVMGWISAFVDNGCKRQKKEFVGLSIVIMSTIMTAFFSSLFRYSTNVIACLIIISASFHYKLAIRR